MLRFTYKKVITVLYNMTYFFMFVTAVCILFLFKLKWPKNKSLHKSKTCVLQSSHKLLNLLTLAACRGVTIRRHADSVSSRISYLRPVQFLTTFFSFYIVTLAVLHMAIFPGLFTSDDYRPRIGQGAMQEREVFEMLQRCNAILTLASLDCWQSDFSRIQQWLSGRRDALH